MRDESDESDESGESNESDDYKDKVQRNIMLDAFIYFMNAYFYQDWQAEYSDHRANDTDVIIRFASKESIEILESLVQDLEYMLENNLAEIIFESNSFDFDPVLNGYANEHAWVESVYKTLIAEIR